MKRLSLFCAVAGLFLGSASPPGAPPVPLAAVSAAPEAVPATDPFAATAPLPQPAPATPAPAPASAPEPAPEPAPAAAPPPPAAKKVKAAPEETAEVKAAGKNRALRIVVSIPLQKAYVFRGSELVATSRVSTGKRGHATPTGRFTILQKKVKHRSNRYANAPMPYMQRLTWSGIALHAGHVPGYPASHGCIRLPRSFAKKLYGMTNHATVVTVTRAKPASASEALELS
jgi:lipoprotein-anchoring transpeptidase ErfK/SrfK